MKKIALFCYLFFLLKPNSVFAYAPSNVVMLLTEFWAEMGPEKPENAWYPEYAKQNISWALEMFEKKELKLQFIYFEDAPSFLMCSYHSDNKHVIGISPEAFSILIWMARLSGQDVKESMRNIFLIGIVHEAEHLRFWQDPHSCEDFVLEETRVWYMVNEFMVSGMIADCRPVLPSSLELDRILSKHGPKSPEFQDFVSEIVNCRDE